MLHEIQAKIKAPKNQKNNFGGYKYRSCEDIVEAAKPILKEYGLALVLTDDVVPVGSRIYVKATAALWKDSTNGSPLYSATGWAREEETKKGMDAAQITGSASSYARKYALNGLFAIDDTKDADATNDHGNDRPSALPLIDTINYGKLLKMVKDGDHTAIQRAQAKFTLSTSQLNEVNNIINAKN